ncbi:hypothetical protein B0T14DRAFT_607910 [Immersiella caudata]|uniref:Uncharacterized protein n=1 Tax=Immersiella caudata TaxID=314043 RepID=A0AA39TYK7_9PEZI|nr:hypothetical protein B0T14DRAFT_607910 [Immersiella caudata]
MAFPMPNAISASHFTTSGISNGMTSHRSHHTVSANLVPSAPGMLPELTVTAGMNKHADATFNTRRQQKQPNTLRLAALPPSTASLTPSSLARLASLSGCATLPDPATCPRRTTLGPVSRARLSTYVSQVAVLRDPVLARQRHCEGEKLKAARAWATYVARVSKQVDDGEGEDDEDDEELVVVERPDERVTMVTEHCVARNGESVTRGMMKAVKKVSLSLLKPGRGGNMTSQNELEVSSDVTNTPKNDSSALYDTTDTLQNKFKARYDITHTSENPTDVFYTLTRASRNAASKSPAKGGA